MPVATTTEEANKLARAAVAHLLVAIQEDPRKYYLLGFGTQSWDCLCKAYAAQYGSTPKEVSARFQPDEAAARRFEEERAREQALLHWCDDSGLTVDQQGKVVVPQKPLHGLN